MFELKPNARIPDLTEHIVQLMEMPNDVQIRLKRMKNEFLPNDAKCRHQNLGRILENTVFEEYKHRGGKVKIAPQLSLKAYMNVYMNQESKYFKPDTEQSNIYNFYESFASLIAADKDIVNAFEKSALALIILYSEI